MFSALPAYLAFARLSFQRQNAYRVANWAGLFTNLFFLFFRASLFESVFPPGQSINGLDRAGALSYVCLTQAIVMVVPQWGFLGVDEDIRTGQITTHLSRPVNFFLTVLAQRLGTSGFFLVFRTLPILFVGALTGFLFPPASAAHAGLFLVSVFLGAWIAICLHFLAELSAFWLENARGTKILAVGLVNFFSGLVLPIALFPEPARRLSALLPFEYTLNAPVTIYLGGSVGRALLGQLLWAAALWALSARLLRAGERKVVLHGG